MSKDKLRWSAFGCIFRIVCCCPWYSKPTLAGHCRHRLALHASREPVERRLACIVRWLCWWYRRRRSYCSPSKRLDEWRVNRSKPPSAEVEAKRHWWRPVFPKLVCNRSSFSFIFTLSHSQRIFHFDEADFREDQRWTAADQKKKKGNGDPICHLLNSKNESRGLSWSSEMFCLNMFVRWSLNKYEFVLRHRLYEHEREREVVFNG